MTAAAPTLAPRPAAEAVPVGVVLASIVLAASVVPLLAQLPHERAAFESALPLVAWLPLGVAGVVAIDRSTRSLVGWACVVAATTPVVLAIVGLVWSGGSPEEPGLVRVTEGGGPLTLLAVAVPALAAWSRRRVSRADARWSVWVVGSCLLTMSSASVAWFVGSSLEYGVVSASGIGLVAVVVGASGVVAEPRPVAEPLVDLVIIAAGLAVTAGTGAAVVAFAQREEVVAPSAIGAVATVFTAALVTPTAWWLRREFLTRRYGTGVLSTADVAALTADLSTAADPRRLLVNAAAMVVAASGIADARLVLDEVDVPEGWTGYPLVVADELVGTMLLRPSHAGGLEVRQERACRQLLPTVALVARAVTLAVDAEHARIDLARQREVERARILADLHDDLGPVLAGLSMRVQAVREAHSVPELDMLATDLALCRADLRRIVGGLAPTALSGGDLAAAITGLVQSFGTGGTVRVALVSDVPDGISPVTAVVVYRMIAEGIANAIRHARPTEVLIGCTQSDTRLTVTVTDDGQSTVNVVPGVGLRSLADRAREIGGELGLEPVAPSGTRLSLTVPSCPR